MRLWDNVDNQQNHSVLYVYIQEFNLVNKQGIGLGSTIFLFPQGVYIQDWIVFSVLHSVINLIDKCKVGSSLISIM